MKFQVCILFTILIISISAQINEDVKTIITGNNKMLIKLYPKISTPQKNLIFSPISLHTILSLVYQGSAGTTEEECRTVLNIPDKLKTAEGYKTIMAELNNLPNITLNIANHVYIQDGLSMKPKFQTIAKEKFAAEADNIDFINPDAKQIMNKWVEDKTNNKIQNLIEGVDPNTAMILINAVYFKGDWKTSFDKKDTQEAMFYVSENEKVSCQMMRVAGDFNYKDDSDLEAQVLELPYKNVAISMIIVLPHSRTGLADLETKLVNVDLEKVTQNLSKIEVKVNLPKFKIESTLDLIGTLQKIGLVETLGHKPNLSELVPASVKISAVIQKAFIEVNEEGAEASAATYVEVVMFNGMTVGTSFYADHSFLAFLKYKNIILFVAKVERI